MKTRIGLLLCLLQLTFFHTSANAQTAQPQNHNSVTSAFAGHDLSPWGMYQAADIVVKSVMVGLVLASLLTWTIWLFKVVQLAFARRRSQLLLAQLIDCQSFAQVERKAQESLKPSGDKATQSAQLLVKACRQEFNLSRQGQITDHGLKERVNARLERVQNSLLADINTGTGVLATIGSVAPFVGLFGTVWGIMNSFIGIAESQTTNLAIVAPGIAEALLATALGLVAAIPAVIIYNYFARAINSYRSLLTDISTALMITLSRDLDQQHRERQVLTSIVSGNNSVVTAQAKC
ncbi:tonB-system energizer ExbB [Endozoicomonas sp. G2_1]|uniref:tonB-system energizer ExbB n=1 Tax=Endozoicomonas sp. G2_1 TaxID=2821091 RepID=UPI001ADA695C|nr:tonB-system energizer ExbB [Endozoicomonas sp. G2_1]MBO9489684.1 tonB-system energizer ExbB [Endozoicomonas sp. G2_1]